VTTAALAAGVDFPASQVLFASLTMGIKWLTVAEFEQMCGRAGRLKKHDLGKVYVLITPGKNYVGTVSDTEDRVADRLFHGKIEPLQLTPNEDAHFTELLALISMYTPLSEGERGISRDTIAYFHSLLYNGDFALKRGLDYLVENGFVRKVWEGSDLRTTTFGRAVAESFLRVDQANEIRTTLMQPVTEDEPAPDPLDIARVYHPFNNVYVTNRILSELSAKNQGKSTSNNLFSNAVLSLVDAQNVGKKGYVSRRLFNVIRAWAEDIFNCVCKERPYCDCGRDHVERIIIDSRLEGLTLNQISEGLVEEFEILVFRGDLTDFFEGLIHLLQSIHKMGRALAIPAQTMLKIRSIPRTIQRLIQPPKPQEGVNAEGTDNESDDGDPEPISNYRKSNDDGEEE
jgi:helicase